MFCKSPPLGHLRQGILRPQKKKNFDMILTFSLKYSIIYIIGIGYKQPKQPKQAKQPNLKYK
jgi:hypothetical protein